MTSIWWTVVTSNSYFNTNVEKAEEGQEMHHLPAENLLVFTAIVCSFFFRRFAYLD